MNRYFQFLLIVASVFAFATGAVADPIGIIGGQCYTAKWVMASETNCDQVCRRDGMSAESLTLSSASTQKIFVCRHKGSTKHSFGEQGSGNCRIPEKKPKYECLCVRNSCIMGHSGDGLSSEGMSEKHCVARLKRAIETLKLQPDRKTYAKALRICSRGDFKRAIEVVKESG